MKLYKDKRVKLGFFRSYTFNIISFTYLIICTGVKPVALQKFIIIQMDNVVHLVSHLNICRQLFFLRFNSPYVSSICTKL